MDSGIEFRIFFSQSTVNFVLKTIFDTLTTVHTISDIRKDQGYTRYRQQNNNYYKLPMEWVGGKFEIQIIILEKLNIAC